MMSKKENSNEIKKIIPSKLETGFQQILYKTNLIVIKKVT